MNKYIIAIDGGGTKTLAVLFDINGQEIKRVQTGYSNFSVNIDETTKHIKEAINQLLLAVGDEDAVVRIQMGISGYSSVPDKNKLQQEFHDIYHTEIGICTDAEIALYSLQHNEEDPVIMVIGGTGSVVMYNKDNELQMIGGFGHLLGDQGSAYHLVITTLQKIIHDVEEQLPLSPLSKNILKQLDIEDYKDLKQFVYNSTKSEIAHLSNTIAGYAESGDQDAIELLEHEGVYLALQTLRAYNSMKPVQSVIIGTRGGFINQAPYVKQAFLRELDQRHIPYHYNNTPKEPVYGAYFLATKLLS